MDGQEKLLDYVWITAAVAGEKWATEKVLSHYAECSDCNRAFHDIKPLLHIISEKYVPSTGSSGWSF